MKRYIVAILFFITPLCAVGEAGAIFLLIAPGASATSTGEAQVAKANDTYATYYNPAGLGFQRAAGVAGMHVNWLPNLADDLYYEFLAFKKPISSGMIGGHLIFLNLGEQMATDENGNELGSFRSYMYAFAGSYGTKITKKSSIGVNFKVFHQKLADSVTASEVGDPWSTDFGFDIGYLKKFNYKKEVNASESATNTAIKNEEKEKIEKIFENLFSLHKRQNSLNEEFKLANSDIDSNSDDIVEENIDESTTSNYSIKIDSLKIELDALKSELSVLDADSESLNNQIESHDVILTELYTSEPINEIVDTLESAEYQTSSKTYFGDYKFIQENDIFSLLEVSQIVGVAGPDYLNDKNRVKHEFIGELDKNILSIQAHPDQLVYPEPIADIWGGIGDISSQNDIDLDQAKLIIKKYKKLSTSLRSSVFPLINVEIKEQLKAWELIAKRRTKIKSYFSSIDRGMDYNEISPSDVLFLATNIHLLTKEVVDWSFTDEMNAEKSKLTVKQLGYFSDLIRLGNVESITSSDETVSFVNLPFFVAGLWRGNVQTVEISVENPDFLEWIAEKESVENTLNELNHSYNQINAEIDEYSAIVSSVKGELNLIEKTPAQENKQVAKLKSDSSSTNNPKEYSNLIRKQEDLASELSAQLTEFIDISSLREYYNTDEVFLDFSETLENLIASLNNLNISESGSDLESIKTHTSNMIVDLNNLLSTENEFMVSYNERSNDLDDGSLIEAKEVKEKGEFNFGLTLSNIGPSIDFVDASQADPAPTNLKFGIYKEFIINKYNKINFLFDINKLMVAKYAPMDINGDGTIDTETNEAGHSDPWYKAIVTSWFDDWFYNYDRDYDADTQIGGFMNFSGQYRAFTTPTSFTDPIEYTEDVTIPGFDTQINGPGWSNGWCNQMSNYYYNGYNLTKSLDYLDAPDVFEDDNGDGIWNPPEPYYDEGNGIFTEFLGLSDDLGDYQYIVDGDEYWIYYNTIDSKGAIVQVEVNTTVIDNNMINTITGIDWGNGSWETTEGYVDWDDDGYYDEGELWTLDVNGNGTYNTAYSPLNDEGVKEVGSGDDYTFKDELKELIANFGMEYWYTDNFAIRLGYIYDKEGSIMNPTFGAGIKFSQYGFDFGYTAGAQGHARANTMFFSISIGM